MDARARPPLRATFTTATASITSSASTAPTSRPIDKAHAARSSIPPRKPTQRRSAKRWSASCRRRGKPERDRRGPRIDPAVRAGVDGAPRLPGLKVLRWESHWDRDGQPPIDPADFPELSVATTGTHDIEPLAATPEGRARRAAQAVLQSLLSAGSCLDPDPAAGRLRLDRSDQHAGRGGRHELDVAPAVAGGHDLARSRGAPGARCAIADAQWHAVKQGVSDRTRNNTATGPIAAPQLDGATAWLNVARADLDGADCAARSCSSISGPTAASTACTCCGSQDARGSVSPTSSSSSACTRRSSPTRRTPTTCGASWCATRSSIRWRNDASMRIWRRYGAQAWPTRVIIDPAGNLVGTAMGEGNLEGFVHAIRDRHPRVRRTRRDQPHAAAARSSSATATPIAAAVSRARCSPIRARPPVHRRLQPQPHRRRHARTGADRHDRIRPAGRWRRHFLAGALLSAAGPRARSPIDLYVADTENHQIRAVDFEARVVETVAGTGKQAPGAARAARPLSVDLNSPWDLALKPGILIVAMAGPHQLWVIDLRARPGLSVCGHRRRSAARRRGQRGRVRAAVRPRDRRQHALRRGRRVQRHSLGRAAARQHGHHACRRRSLRVRRSRRRRRPARGCSIRSAWPLHDGRVFIADTYNHKIRCSIRGPGACRRSPGMASPASRTAEAARAVPRARRPLRSQGYLFVADTNNHAIRTIDRHRRSRHTRVRGAWSPGGLELPARLKR